METKVKAMLRSIVEKYQKEELENKQQMKKFIEPYVAAYVEELRRKMELMRYYEMLQRCKISRS